MFSNCLQVRRDFFLIRLFSSWCSTANDRCNFRWRFSSTFHGSRQWTAWHKRRSICINNRWYPHPGRGWPLVPGSAPGGHSSWSPCGTTWIAPAFVISADCCDKRQWRSHWYECEPRVSGCITSRSSRRGLFQLFHNETKYFFIGFCRSWNFVATICYWNALLKSWSKDGVKSL